MKFQIRVLLVSGVLATMNPAAEPFTFVRVQMQAEQLASKPYVADSNSMPAWLGSLDYVGYREIEFRVDHAWWQTPGSPFRLSAYHRGGLFRDRVTLNEIDAQGEAHEWGFDARAFNYRALGEPSDLTAELGFAGWRALHPLNRPGVWDEAVSFLGASYFRAVPAAMAYGLSARGLAVDSGLPDRREEFPRFREFWLKRPVTGETSLHVWALLDGPRVTGAYAFEIKPGTATVMEVHATLYFREAVPETGWAPLTSMFWYGEQDVRPQGEHRPEVHDSDGLWVRFDEAPPVWRPLQAVDRATLSEFRGRRLRGFGLLQRDRNFEHYQDNEAHYHRRPSAWVEPLGDWGPGRVRLVELAADREYADNVGAHWVPDAVAKPGEPVTFGYRLIWGEMPAEQEAP